VPGSPRARSTPRLDRDLRWRDIVAASFLASIGFTVSLLVGELAFDTGEEDEAVKVGVLTGSLLAATAGAVMLRLRAASLASDRA
jgi:NhaA family Na+:H+ antiporter